MPVSFKTRECHRLHTHTHTIITENPVGFDGLTDRCITAVVFAMFAALVTRTTRFSVEPSRYISCTQAGDHHPSPPRLNFLGAVNGTDFEYFLDCTPNYGTCHVSSLWLCLGLWPVCNCGRPLPPRLTHIDTFVERQLRRMRTNASGKLCSRCTLTSMTHVHAAGLHNGQRASGKHHSPLRTRHAYGRR